MIAAVTCVFDISGKLVDSLGAEHARPSPQLVHAIGKRRDVLGVVELKRHAHVAEFIEKTRQHGDKQGGIAAPTCAGIRAVDAGNIRPWSHANRPTWSAEAHIGSA